MEERLLIKLYQLRRRATWVQAVAQGLRWGLWAGWLSLVVMMLLAGLGLSSLQQLEALAAWPALALLGFFRGLGQAPSLRRVAHRADQFHGLQERLLTCYSQVQSRAPKNVVSQLLLQDTLQRVETLDPRQTFPNPWQRPLLRWSVPALALTLTWLILPSPHPPSDPGQAEVLASRQRLQRLQKRLQQKRPASPQARRLEELLQRLPQQVPAQAARQLRQQQQQLQRQLAEQEGLAQQIESLQKALAGNPSLQDSKRLEELTKKAEEIGSAAQAPLQKAEEALASGQKEALTRALEQARQELQQGQETQEQLATLDALEEELQQLDPGGRLASAGDAPGEGSLSPSSLGPAPGKGQGSLDFGLGDTNQQDGQTREATQKARGHRQHGRTSEKQAEFERLYGVERQSLEMRRESVALRGASGKLLKMSETRVGDASPGARSLLPLEEQQLQARVMAEQALAEEKIPAAYREAVRRYFDRP